MLLSTAMMASTLAPSLCLCSAEPPVLMRSAPNLASSCAHVSSRLIARSSAPLRRRRSLGVVASASSEGGGQSDSPAEAGTPKQSRDSLLPLPLFPWQSQMGSFLPPPGPAPTLLPMKEDPPVLRLSAGAPLEMPASRMLQGADSAPMPLLPLSRSEAQGIILRAAMGTGWTTQTGLEGPSLAKDFPSPVRARAGPSHPGTDMLPLEGQGGTAPASSGPRRSWPELTSSPRRTSRVKFTCKRCGERTVRAINPHAYEEGTVFVQCGGCMVFHKLVDNLNLFHELQGSVFLGSDAGNRGFGVHESVDVLGLEDPLPNLPFN